MAVAARVVMVVVFIVVLGRLQYDQFIAPVHDDAGCTLDADLHRPAEVVTTSVRASEEIECVCKLRGRGPQKSKVVVLTEATALATTTKILLPAPPSETPATSPPSTTAEPTTAQPTTAGPTIPPGVTNHSDDVPPGCKPFTTEDAIRDWRNSERVVCQAEGATVKEYVHTGYEFRPAFRTYENVTLPALGRDIFKLKCDPEKTRWQVSEQGAMGTPYFAGGRGADEWSGRTILNVSDRVIYRVKRFDIVNIYEAMNAYINVYMTIRILQIPQEKLQFLFTDGHGKSDMDDAMWRSFCRDTFPIIYPGSEQLQEKPGHPVRVTFMIDASSTGTSVLVTNTGVELRGRGVDHHCKSELFRNATAWMRRNFAINPPAYNSLHTKRVVWSSRQTYPRLGRMETPMRVLLDEDAFLRLVRQQLGEGYELVSLDFGKLGANESIQRAVEADIMVGVHGAGLMWSAFLPRHGGLIEVFGGDRPEGHRHYHNVASLADIHYRSLSIEGAAHQLRWSPSTINVLANLIKEIPVGQATEP